METRSNGFRYERKFLVDRLDQHQVMGLVKRHPSMFFEPYPPRFVNNFYFDTPDMQNYHDNVSGAANRRKLRIRWYGELMGRIESPVLELKVKRGLVGTKRHYPIATFDLADDIGARMVMPSLFASELPPEVVSYLHTVTLVLMNRYHRRYYVSRDGKFRLTLDTNMAFHRVGGLTKRLARRRVDHRNVIVELKYGVDEDVAASRVSGFFPFRVTKSSKYVQGIDRVFL
jgi:SPX domain protein involved in polyphosphate accumulation